jgi:peptide alpha-N-acetyltransferase
MKLYERLGFLRSKRLHRYYLNGNTAFRFLLYIKTPSEMHYDEGDDEADDSIEHHGPHDAKAVVS